MKKIFVFYKQPDGGEEVDTSRLFTEYKALQVNVSDGFLNIIEDATTGRKTHISLSEISSWSEENHS